MSKVLINNDNNNIMNNNINLIQDGGGRKDLPTSCSPVSPTTLGISPQNFLTFNYNPFATLV